MNEFSQRLQWARVEYDPGVAQAVFARLSAFGGSSDSNPLSGMTGSESVQVAAYLAALRDMVASWDTKTGGPYVTMAMFRDGRGEKVLAGTTKSLAGYFTQGTPKDATFTPIVGDAPFRSFAMAASDKNPTDHWGKKLALACDELLQRFGKSEQGGDVPPQMMPTALPLVPLVVIVTGAALAVIGSVAVWRFLDPDLRRDMVVVEQAARSYAERLGVWKTTGTMPPPSPAEEDALSTVESMAKSRGQSDWLWGAGIAGGITLAALVSVAISRAASGRRAA